jgi:type III pantothenate kinase
MLLAIDIGNSAIKFGVFDGPLLISKFSIPTVREISSDELKSAIGDRLDLPISAAIACSVVPQLDEIVKTCIRRIHEINVGFIDHTFAFGLKINYRPSSAAGADRLINAFAAVAKYGKPCIVGSLGTATTIDAVNAEGEFLGGFIAPGMKTMARALHLAAAKLPEVEISRPASVIGGTTESSIRSGIFYGYAALVQGLIERLAEELQHQTRVIATGGFAALIATDCTAIDIVDENLTLDGLRLAFERISDNSVS